MTASALSSKEEAGQSQPVADLQDRAFGVQYRQRLATCILTEGIRPLIWPWQLLHDTTTYLKVVNMGTNKAGLPKTFIIRPCLPLVASTRNKDRNIFKNPRCSCRTSACVSFAFVCRLHDILMFQCRYCQFQVCSLYQLQSRDHKVSRVLPGPQSGRTQSCCWQCLLTFVPHALRLIAFDSDMQGSMGEGEGSPLTQTCFSAWPRFACGSWARAPAPGSVSYPVHQLTAGSISVPECPPARFSMIPIWDAVLLRNVMALSDGHICALDALLVQLNTAARHAESTIGQYKMDSSAVEMAMVAQCGLLLHILQTAVHVLAVANAQGKMHTWNLATWQ